MPHRSHTAPQPTVLNATAAVADEVCTWFDREGRDLPWRSPDTTPWGVLVSEFMLQQTPVSRVVGPWRDWVTRWPTPADLAAATVGDAVRAWGRLGYPRRAKRLHETAIELRDRFGGQVPRCPEELRTLPGVGEYTAAAIAGFAYATPSVIVDTNVRRVQARLFSGAATPARSYSAAERALAHAVAHQLPPRQWPHWHAAVMELGAVVCTASNPNCGGCPVAARCAWQAAGCPTADPAAAAKKPSPGYYGTDRYVRGLVLGLLRDQSGPVPVAAVDTLWPQDDQRDRAVASLVADGLVVEHAGTYALPT